MTELTTIVMHSSKGGSGKTFLAANIGKILALGGKKCVLIDGDLTGPSFNAIFASRAEIKWYINDLLLGKGTVEQAICHTAIEGLDIIYANPRPIVGKGLIVADQNVISQALQQLSEVIYQLNRLSYDVLLFDATPGLNLLSLNALLVTRNVVIVVRPDRYSLQTTHHILDTVYAKVKHSGLGLKNYFLIFNQVPHASSEKIKRLLSDYKAEIRKKQSITVLGHMHCLCTEIGETLIETPLLCEEGPGMAVIKSITEKLVPSANLNSA